MRQMTSDLDTPVSAARAGVVELDRRTATVESQYDAARIAYLEAAQQLHHHGGNYARKVVQLVELGGTVPPNVRDPRTVDLVTIEEVEAYVP
jgi:hypothetical protein